MERIENKKKSLDDMTPKEIVKALDEYVIGQDNAKRTLAIAIRNRVRRKRLPDEIKDEVSPKNILMIGSTGIGKTEIARRISKLANAPFIKVEATKYTEVGYVGRDVESMVRDLMGIAVSMVKSEMASAKESEIEKRVEDRLFEIVLPSMNDVLSSYSSVSEAHAAIRRMLREGMLDNREVELTVPQAPPSALGINAQSMDDIQEALSSLSQMFSGGSNKTKRMSIRRARERLKEEEMEKIVDQDKAVDEALERVQEMGIIFIDEIDKVASRGNTSNADVSREGVQRDILPIVEGTKVSTKWGVVDTTNILFIAAGAFSMSKPSDLIPELQGRFPLRVELQDLARKEFYRILKEPQNAITKQYKELLSTEGVNIEFDDEALEEIAKIAEEVNKSNDNIGARRLYTIMEKLLEELAFSADELSGQTVKITKSYVDERLKNIVEDQDLSRYIL